MKAFWIVCLLIMLVPGTLRADIKGVEAILQMWGAQNREWDAAYEFASPEGRQHLLASKPDEVATARALWKEASGIINSPDALNAVIWLLDHSGGVSKAFDPATQNKIANTLIGALQGDSIKLKGAGRVTAALSNSTNPQCRYILEQIRSKNPHSVDQGLAAMGLALMMRENQGMRRDSPRMNAVRLKYIREAIVKAFDEPFAGRKLSDFATELLYEINNLHVRRKAPLFELTGENGDKVKVPNGEKHTLLVFWSPNVPVSHSFAAMSQELASKYPDLELIVLCPEMKSREGLEVKTFFDTPKGDTFRLYRVSEVPWICLLDKQGVVRMRGVPDAMFTTLLDQAMQTINSPLKADKKNQPVSGEGNTTAPLPGTKTAAKVLPPVKTPIPAASSSPEGDGEGMMPPPLKPIPLD